MAVRLKSVNPLVCIFTVIKTIAMTYFDGWGWVCVAGPGDYFGELALLNNDRRRATVKATRPTLCLTLGRETFKRLLGPLEAILKGREEVYEKYSSERLK